MLQSCIDEHLSIPQRPQLLYRVVDGYWHPSTTCGDIPSLTGGRLLSYARRKQENNRLENLRKENCNTDNSNIRWGRRIVTKWR